MQEVLLDSFLDSLKLLPFLFLLYILIEVLEHKTAVGKPTKALTGKAAPLIGSSAGLVPMCGFSVMASKLYERKYLTIGTLLAVLIATSDEALLVLLISDMKWGAKLIAIFALLGTKFVIAAGVGYLADMIANKRFGTAYTRCPLEEDYEHMHEDEHDREEAHDDLSACEHDHESKLMLYLASPLLHALQIAAVVFAFNLAFGFLFWYIGEEKVIDYLQGAGFWYQPIVACLVGLVPNCASSVALAETYALGGITFGSILGGLITNTGLGALVLFRNLKAWKRNVAIVAIIFILGIIVAYAVNGITIIL